MGLKLPLQLPLTPIMTVWLTTIVLETSTTIVVSPWNGVDLRKAAEEFLGKYRQLKHNNCAYTFWMDESGASRDGQNMAPNKPCLQRNFNFANGSREGDSLQIELWSRKYSAKCNVVLVHLNVIEDKGNGRMPDIRSIFTSGSPAKDVFIFVSFHLVQLQTLLSLQELQGLKYSFGLECLSAEGERIKRVITKLDQEGKFFSQVPHVDVSSWSTVKANNLPGKHVIMAGIHIPPLLLANDEKVAIGGSIFEMYKIFSAHFNFTLKILFGIQGGTGRKLKGGQWTGIMGELLAGKVDQAAVLRLTPPRYGLVDFSTFLCQDQPVFFKAHPQRTVRWDLLISPFTLHVWLLTLMEMTLVVLSASVFLKFDDIIVTAKDGKVSKEPSHDSTNKRNRDLTETKGSAGSRSSLISANSSQASKSSQVKSEKKPRTWLDCVRYSFFLVYQLSLEQGAKIFTCTRPVLIFWLLTVLVLGCLYKERLFTGLSFPVQERTPETLEELALRPDYTIVYNYWKSSLYNLFNTSSNPVHQEVLKRFQLEPKIVNCVLRSIFEPKTVCIGFQGYMDFTIASNATVKSNFRPGVFVSSIINHDPMYLGIALPKNSIYTPAWNQLVGMVRDTGMMSQMNQRVLDLRKDVGRKRMEGWRNSSAASSAHGNNEKSSKRDNYVKLKNLVPGLEQVAPLSFRHIQVIVSIWGAFLALTTITFSLELLICKSPFPSPSILISEERQSPSHSSFMQ